MIQLRVMPATSWEMLKPDLAGLASSADPAGSFMNGHDRLHG
jgi:hypothetical protein